MATPFALNLRLNLSTFKASLGEVRAGLAGLAARPVQALQQSFGPAVAGARRLAGAVREAQFALLGLAGAAGAGLAAISREAAGDEAMLQRFKVTFGELSDEVGNFASELALSTRRTEGGVQGLLVGFQDVLRGMQFTGQEAAGFSQQLTRLTVDLAAFRGESEEEILSTLQTALVRGGPAITKFGVLLDEARIKQEAFNRGFDPENLTEQQEALLKLNIIMQDTQVAQGAAANTAATFRERILGLRNAFAELLSDLGRNFNAQLGPLLDTMRESIGAVREWIAENPRLAATLAAVGTAVLGFVAALGTLAPILANALGVLGALGGVVVSAASGLLSLPGALAAVAAAFAGVLGAGALGGLIEGLRRFIAEGQGAGQVLAGLREGFTRAFDGLRSAAERIIEPVRAFIAQVGGEVFGVLEANANALGSTFSGLGDRIGAVLETAGEAIRGVLAEAFRFLAPIAVRAVQGIITVFNELPTILDAVVAAAQRMGGFLADIFGIVIGRVGDTGRSFESWQVTVNGVIRGIVEALSAPSIIRLLARIRIAVAAIGFIFGEVLGAAQILAAGWTLQFGLIARAVAQTLRVLGLVSDTAAKAADDLATFADEAINRAGQLAEEGAQKMVDVARRTGQEIESALYDFENADTISRRLKAEGAAREETLKQLREARALVVAKVKDEEAGFKAELDARVKSGELTVAQKEEYLRAAEAARAVLDAELARATSQEEALKVQPAFSRALDEQRVKIEAQVQASRQAVQVEGQKAEAGRKYTEVQKEQEEAAKRLAQSQEDVNRAAEALIEARVRATQTINDDLALLARQRDAALANAKTADEADKIRLKFLLEQQRVVEETARKERDAARQALQDLRDRAATFDDFVTGINRAFERRRGRDLEVQIEEIGDQFKEQLGNLTRLGDLPAFKDALGKALSEPLEAATDRAREAREELNRLLAERARAQAEGADFGQVNALQQQVNQQREAVATADARIRSITDQANQVQAGLSSQLKGMQEQLAAKEREAAALRDQAAEADRLDREGAAVDPAQAIEAQGRANEAAGRAREAAVAAQGAAQVTAGAAERLATVVTDLGNAARSGIEGLRGQVEQVILFTGQALQAITVIPQVSAALDRVIAEQQAFGQSVNEFGDVIVSKFAEASVEFGRQRRLFDGLSARIKAIELGRAAGGGEIGTALPEGV